MSNIEDFTASLKRRQFLRKLNWMAFSELPWRPFLAHQAWSWTTLRWGNVFLLRLQRFFSSRFTFLTFFIWPFFTSMLQLVLQPGRRFTGWNVHGGPKKPGHRLMTRILSNVNRFTIFLLWRFRGKFAVKCILKIPSHLAYVATPLCETCMSAKQAINDKLQGSVATYLRCGRVVNNQIKKGLLLSVRVKFFWIDEYLAKLQARTWLSHALCAPVQHTAKRRM